MKTKVELLAVVFLSANAAMELDAQGYIAFNNLATNSGFVYLLNGIQGRVLMDQDVSFDLYGGASPLSLQPIHTWLVGDGSATGINVAPGRFADPSHGVYAIPGVEPGGAAYLQLRGWRGNFDTYAAAVSVGDIGITAFQNPTGIAGSAPGLTGLDFLVIGIIPEPSVLALTSAGALALLLWRRRQTRHNEEGNRD